VTKNWGQLCNCDILIKIFGWFMDDTASLNNLRISTSQNVFDIELLKQSTLIYVIRRNISGMRVIWKLLVQLNIPWVPKLTCGFRRNWNTVRNLIAYWYSTVATCCCTLCLALTHLSSRYINTHHLQFIY